MIGRGDDDGVDVLVVEDTSEVLHEVRLERGDVAQARVVDPLGREIRVDVTQRLDLDVGEPRKAALERVALAADADAPPTLAGDDDAPPPPAASPSGGQDRALEDYGTVKMLLGQCLPREQELGD